MIRILKNHRRIALEIVALLLALICLSPFYFVIVNSFKSYKEILIDPASLPVKWILDNYINTWKELRFPAVFANSLIITICSNLGIIIISSMAAYRLLRVKTKLNKAIFGIFVMAMVIPFQSIMIPLVRVMSSLNLNTSNIGLIICYFGFGVSFPVFLYHGFMKSIPISIEEAAIVDGCTSLGVFFKMVMPLLKPMTATVIILNTLWIWNDFLLPSLMLHSRELYTIPLAMNGFFAKYTKQWDLALAGLVLSIAPMIILFLSLQKNIINGIVSGSVKG